jgi:tetratricopeptide (TPR) repeat protein
MRLFQLFAALAFVMPAYGAATVSPAFSQDVAKPDIAEQTASQDDTLNRLFATLKKERNADKAKSIAAEIQTVWRDSGSATVNLLMQWAADAAGEKRQAAAFDFLDQVTVLDPDYPEAWNRRAALHYVDGETRKAMADLDQVLTAEPRYFPALASLAGVLELNGHDALAMKAWEQYLALYPADKEAQKEVQKLSEKLAGTRS